MRSPKVICRLIPMLAMAAIGGCANNRPCNDQACVADQQTTAAVTTQLRAHPDLGAPARIRVQTVDHVVYLSGTVNSGFQQETAESIANETPGVSRVVSTIGISK
jgi:osmotically-inducible protein OsmY